MQRKAKMDLPLYASARKQDPDFVIDLHVFSADGLELPGESSSQQLRIWDHMNSRLQLQEPLLIYYAVLHEEREERFVTDECGFRNDSSDAGRFRPLDAIILGDSMADGANTTQENILSSVLSRDYGYRTYNLSMTGVGCGQSTLPY